MDLDPWPIGREGGQLASERTRLRDAEVHVDRSAISPTLNEHQTVSVVDMVVDVMTDASRFATRPLDVLATQRDRSIERAFTDLHVTDHDNHARDRSALAALRHSER